MLMNEKNFKTTLRFTTFNARNEMPVFCLHISSSLHSSSAEPNMLLR